jgi:hypothetical protein
MLSRAVGIFIASWLPALAVILPLSAFHRANTLVAGLMATALSALAMVSDRARAGAAIVGAWVAFTPLVVRSSLLELVLCGCWGVTMFVSLGGPFSQTAQTTWVRPQQRPAQQSSEPERFAAAA